MAGVAGLGFGRAEFERAAAMDRAVAECEAEEAIREGLTRQAESERRWMRAAAEAERAALEAERAAPPL